LMVSNFTSPNNMAHTELLLRLLLETLAGF
jgi:hypothetical protein